MKKVIFNYIRRFEKCSWGGTEEACMQICNSMKDDFAPEIHSLSFSEEESVTDFCFRYKYFYPYFSIIRGCGVREKFDRKGGNPISFGLILSCFLKNNLAVIHAHTLGVNAFLLLIVAWMRGVPFFVTIHGGKEDVPLQEREYFKELYKGTLCYLKPFLFFFNDDFVLRSADSVFVVNHNEVELLNQKGVENVKYLPNGVNSLYQNEGRKNSEVKENYFINVGRIDPQKNQLLAIKAFEKFSQIYKDYKLYLVGSTTDCEYLEEIINYVNKNKLEDKVIVMGQLNPASDELKNIFKKSSCLLQTSLHEPFGITVLEAMSLRCPVIASKVGGMAHIFDDQEHGYYFEPENINDLVIKMKRVVEQNSEMTEKAYELVCEKYSWDKVSNDLVESYRLSGGVL